MRRLVLSLFLFVCCGAFFYHDSWNYPLLLDDLHLISKNLWTQTGRFDEIWTSDVFAGSDLIKNKDFRLGYFSPVSMSLVALVYQIWGDEAFVYHLINFILHLSACLWGALIFFRYFKDGFLAIFAALYFFLHPLRVESVVWVAGFHDLWGLNFYLLGVLLIQSSTQETQRKSALILKIAAWLFLSASVLCK